MKGHESGISLIEILAATFLMSIAIIPMLTLYPDTLGINRETEYDVILSAAAIRRIEENINLLRGAAGPVTFDALASAGSSSASISTSASITIDPASNYIVVLIGIRSTSTTVLSVTVGATPATFLLAQDHPSIARRAELWRLQNPPAGTVTVTVTMTGSIRHAWVAASFRNVLSTTPLGSSNSNTGNSAGPAVIISPRTADSMMVGGFFWDAVAPTITEGGGQTAIGTVSTTGGSRISTHLARETTPGTAGIDLSWTNSATQEWIALAGELRGSPAVVLPSGTAACADLPNCRLVWTTTTELSDATQGVGALWRMNVVACQDANGNSACDIGERRVRYDAKATSRP